MRSVYLGGHSTVSSLKFRCRIPYLGAIICVVAMFLVVCFKSCENDGKRLVASQGEYYQLQRNYQKNFYSLLFSYTGHPDNKIRHERITDESLSPYMLTNIPLTTLTSLLSCCAT
jgi:hypothetical protein